MLAGLAPRSLRAEVALLLAACLLAFPARASAQEAVAATTDAAAQAREHIAQGTMFFEPTADSGNQPNYEAALAEFEEAHRLMEGSAGRYLLLWNIGQCYERMFRYDRALEYYRRYLDEGGPDAADRAAVEATLHALDGLLGSLRITTNVPEASVWIDGLEAGHAPGDVRVTSGVHRVELRADGWVPALEQVQVTARQVVPIAIELRRVSDYHGLDPTAFWVTSGIAAAVLIAGAAIGIDAFVDYSGLGPIVTAEDHDRLFPLTVTADVLYATGGALAIAAVVLAFVTDWNGASSSTTSPVALLPLVTSDRIGLVFGGSL